MIKEYNKLVRVKIPKIIREAGKEARSTDVHYLDPKCESRFKEKLQEEMTELIEAVASDEVIEEAADVIQVVLDYIKLRDFTAEELEIVRLAKEVKRGAFLDEKGMGRYLINVEEK